MHVFGPREEKRVERVSQSSHVFSPRAESIGISNDITMIRQQVAMIELPAKQRFGAVG